MRGIKISLHMRVECIQPPYLLMLIYIIYLNLQGKEAQVEWCEPLNCGPSDVRFYNEGTVVVSISSRLYLICWRYLLMAVLTGSIIMYEQALGCMGRKRWPGFGDCIPAVSEALGISGFI